MTPDTVAVTAIDYAGGEDAAGEDVRPIVGRDSGNRPLWIALSAILGAGMLLFGILEARRQTLTAPAVRPRAADLAATPSSSPPVLYIPPELFAPPRQMPALPQPEPEMPSALIAPPFPRPRAPEPVFPVRQEPVTPTSAPAPPAVSNTPAVVFDTTGSDEQAGQAVPGPGRAAAGGAGSSTPAWRARAARSFDRATVVPRGTLIAAVLETALDSTQPGQARALVSRDVANLHGDAVLIPRGSRLFGEYNGELAAGQKRAQVLWTRLVRPDGVTVAIESPAADRLGRAGIRGRVNTHFLERLAGALLQSSIDIGTGVATRSISRSSVVVALPGSVQGATSQLVGPTPKPTLTVPHGTRISVFVARDLDFTAVENRR